MTAVCGSMWVRPTYQDLSGIYAGALVARLGAWDALYPTPGDPRFYIGADARPKPAMTALVRERDIAEANPYLNPPWQAWVLAPLGYLRYGQAHWVTVILLTLATWRLGTAAGRWFAGCLGRETRVAGVLTLVVVLSPVAYRSIRVQNVSPIVALCLAGSIESMLRQRPAATLLGAVEMAIGFALKLATLALVPLALAMRRWAMLAITAVVSLLIVAATYASAGRPIFDEFFGVVGPSLSRSSTNPGNKSLQGVLLRVLHAAPLSPSVNAGFRALEVGSLLALLAIVFTRRRDTWRHPQHVLAAGCALVCWLLIFSPLTWEHYATYLMPWWGYLAWEATRSRVRAIVATLAIATHWFPLPTLPPWFPLFHHGVPEALNSDMLLGLLAMFFLSVDRLLRRPTPTVATQTSPP